MGILSCVGDSFYIPSCAFTVKYPQLSKAIQEYVRVRHGLSITGCCVPTCTDGTPFSPGNSVYYICHNCAAIVEETHPEVELRSVWELILSDESFPYPDYHGQSITVQDCWRTRDRTGEQDAVRALLKKMNFDVCELPQNRFETDFCGASLYRPTSKKNLELAPHRFIENCTGKFIPHTEAEQRALMREYCKRFTIDKVVGYCKHCVEGLEWGGVDVKHVGSLLFEVNSWINGRKD